jgi:hypothetical protein
MSIIHTKGLLDNQLAMSNVNKESYAVEREPEGSVRPPVQIEEISNTRWKCLDRKYMDGNNVRHLVSAIGNENNNVVE